MSDRHPESEPRRHPWTLVQRLVPLLVFAAIGLLAFPGAGRDDAYISYWPAHSLADLGSLANYNGEAVEQSSSLAWVLVLALLRFVTGASLASLGWAAGIVAGGTAIVLCDRLAKRVELARGSAALAPLGLALAAPFVYWSFSGMETAFQALLALGWVLAASRSSQSSSLGGALVRLLPWTLAVCAVRPESMFVLLCVVGAVTLRPRANEATLRIALWISLAVSIGIIVVARIALFDSWLPQPALAKAGRPIAESLRLGVSYLLLHPVASTLTVIAAVLGLARLLRARSTATSVLDFAGLFVSAQLGFVVFSGGDWMEGARFLAPVLPLALVLVLAALKKPALAWGLLIVLGLSSGRFALHESRSLLAWEDPEVAFQSDHSELNWRESRNLVHLRDEPTLIALEEILAALPAERPPVVLTGQGGLVLFKLLDGQRGRLRVVDRYGLMDRALMNSPTARKVGSSTLGLNLSYGALLEHWEAILAEAKLPEPDLMFDVGIGSREGQALEARGYVEVYRQAGEVVVGGRRQPAKQSVYLKRELAGQLPAERLKRFEFSPSQFD